MIQNILLPKNVNTIFFVGIKGVGMASLAIIAKQAGFSVGGSDVAEEFITDHELKNQGIIPIVGFSPSDIQAFLKSRTSDEVLVITTAAHQGFANPQSVWATDHGYTVITHGQAVGGFMAGGIFGREDFQGISVAGSHGKTTISAMISTFLTYLNTDPSYTVGTSDIFPIGPAGHYGKGSYFIAEADEYISDLTTDRTPKLLYQNPHYAIINNIDFDHPDFYKNVEEVEKVFVRFLSHIKKDGALIINGDDKHTAHLLSHVKDLRVITYGESSNNTYYLSNFIQHVDHSEFSVYSSEDFFGSFRLKVPGKHNALNALGAIALLHTVGYDAESIKNVTEKFLGVKRRIENLGVSKEGAIIIDDYAHHPKEIETTLKTLREVYPHKQIVCIFQPHTYSRLEKLVEPFGKALQNAHHVVLLPIYASAREQLYEYRQVLLQRFVESVRIGKYFQSKTDMIEYVKKEFMGDKYVVVTMGAGDVYKIHEELITYNK